MSLSLLYERFDYRKDDPVLDEERDEEVFSAVFDAAHRKPFGLEDVSLNPLALLTDGDSDIAFYDNRQAVLGLGSEL